MILSKQSSSETNKGWFKKYIIYTILTFISLFIMIFLVTSFKYSVRYSFEYFSNGSKFMEWFWYLAIPSLIANFGILPLKKNKAQQP